MCILINLLNGVVSEIKLWCSHFNSNLEFVTLQSFHVSGAGSDRGEHHILPMSKLRLNLWAWPLAPNVGLPCCRFCWTWRERDFLEQNKRLRTKAEKAAEISGSSYETPFWWSSVSESETYVLSFPWVIWVSNQGINKVVGAALELHRVLWNPRKTCCGGKS